MRKTIVFTLLILIAIPSFASDDIPAPDEFNYLLIINKEHALPEDYVPSDLRMLDVAFVNTANADRMKMREAAAEALERMFEAALRDGIALVGISAYRSFRSQSEVYYRRGNQSKRDVYIAKPGHSEHQTGLAVDLGTKRSAVLSEAFAKSDEGIWVAENAHKFGFIIRYPKGAEAITGYRYEPWHIRYVGDAAEEIKRREIPLETYLEDMDAQKKELKNFARRQRSPFMGE